jgi:iron complex transport system substrate-binding protein
MKTPGKSVLIAILLVAGLVLAGCGSTPTAPTAPEVSPPPEALPGGTTVVDALGRSVQFEELPQRIVVAGKSSLTIIDTLYLFPEAKERVVGLVVGQQKPGAFLSLVDPSFDQKAVLEVEAGPEQIAPLKPDVVVMRSFMKKDLGDALEQLKTPVVYVDLETPEQYFRDMVTLGKLFGNEARAEEIRAFYQARLDRLDESLGALVDDQKPRVLIVQYSDQGGEVALNVPSASWLQTKEAELAGGRPVWIEAAQGGGWTVVNFEQIAAWDPDTVFVISYKADPSQVVEALKADARWQALRAVQEGQVFGFASDLFSWDQPDPRWILGVTWLAGRLYPDRFADLDMVSEATRFFEQMYGMDGVAVEEQILPTLKGDVK